MYPYEVFLRVLQQSTHHDKRFFQVSLWMQLFPLSLVVAVCLFCHPGSFHAFCMAVAYFRVYGLFWMVFVILFCFYPCLFSFFLYFALFIAVFFFLCFVSVAYFRVYGLFWMAFEILFCFHPCLFPSDL